MGVAWVRVFRFDRGEVVIPSQAWSIGCLSVDVELARTSDNAKVMWASFSQKTRASYMYDQRPLVGLEGSSAADSVCRGTPHWG